MTLLFKYGALSKSASEHFEWTLNRYAFPVLLKTHLDYQWIQSNLQLHPSSGEDCMGNTVQKMTHMYSCFSVPLAEAVLYFFYSKKDYDAVCGLPTLVDANPFVSIIGKL